MEAIVLAGGYGTRLQHIVSDVPKPMAPVNGRPFLEYILGYLRREGVRKVVFAVGYKKERIMDFFRNSWSNMELTYSCEEKPLFTGGAIKQALHQCYDEQVFVINGDTYFDVSLKQMRTDFYANQAHISIAVKEMRNFDRYGIVLIDEYQNIVGFDEKQPTKSGFINGGIYLIKRDVLDTYPDIFSFEKDFLEKQFQMLKMRAFPSDGYFIDIGIPQDYYKAQDDFLMQNGFAAMEGIL